MCKVGMVVECHQVCAGSGVGLYAVNLPAGSIVHEVKAQLPRCACPYAEIFHPLLDLQQEKSHHCMDALRTSSDTAAQL